MPTLDYLINTARTRTPTATVLLDGRPWRDIVSLRTSQAFGSGISTGTVIGRNPPVTPTIGMRISWKWGYNGQEVPGFTGEIARPARKSYPNRYTLECRDALWRADRSNQVIATSPLNNITASAAIRYILTTYGGIPASRISLPTFSASGSEWGGSEWTLGTLTPVQWGNTDDNSGGTTALKAAQDICSVLGYWLYADASGIIRAKQMERAPSTSPAHTFQRGVDLLTDGSPEVVEDVDAIRNRIIVKGANTGIDGAQITDTYQTSHPYLPAGVYQEETFSSSLIEYVNESEAGAASATAIAKRVLKVRSRLPIIERHRTKADPRLSVGATVGIKDSGVGYSTAKNFFIYALETSLEVAAGKFDQQHTLDGGTGNSGYTTIPPPDASFSWLLDAETLDGDAIVAVFLDGSGATSLSGGLIVSWDWSTSTTTYTGTPNTASGVSAVLMFLASEGAADITLTVTDTTSKTGTITQTIDLTGADAQPPIRRTLSVAFGAAWAITPDGGATWNTETTDGDAIAVGTIGGGFDDRALPGTYGLIATRGTGGTGLRQTVDELATASTNLVSAGGAITSNIWVNESNPLRVWFAVGTILYRSTDGGVSKTAMAAAPATIHWVQEDASIDNSVFILAGRLMLNATDPTVGWATLYTGPIGSTARQFVRSRDGQVTWIAYTGAPAGESLQRVENGAVADWTATDCRTLALDRGASSLRATVYGITADNPAQIWSFDGLTGLSATQATPTLPSGATAMHMLADPDMDLFYIADFDSVASGTGAVRKLLADQLLLYKEGDTGWQAHMLGFGVSRASDAEIVLLGRGAAGAADKLFHYTKAAGWVAKTLPAAGKYWYKLAASPFMPNSWLLLGNSSNSATYALSGGNVTMADSTACLYRSDDAGATWTPIALPDPSIASLQITDVEWSKVTADLWFIAAQNNTKTTALWRGTGTTAASPIKDTTTTAYLALVPGLEDEVYFAPAAGGGNPIKGIYVDTSDVWTVPTGSALAANASDADYVGLTRQVVIGANNGLWGASDYRTSQPTLIVSGVGESVAYCNGVVFTSGLGIVQISDPFGSATTTQVVGVTTVVNAIRSDRQTQTRAAVKVDTSTSVLVYDGAGWATLIGPADADAAAVSPYIEVITR